MSFKKHVIVIGGGAAGFFAAINLSKREPNTRVTILEKTNKLLSKVKVSGGGRCNVTHQCFDTSELVKNYPRGNKELVQVFSQFSVQETINWFKQEGIILRTEEDGRMFPYSNESQTIIDCFLSLAKKMNIEIVLSCELLHLVKKEHQFQLTTIQKVYTADRVICAIGGSHKSIAYAPIKELGHQIIEPLPSLFTLNLPNETIKKELQGISVIRAEVSIVGTKLNYHGPLLITHWGLSGPAVLKLSAFAAKELFQMNYTANIQINWVFPLQSHEVLKQLKLLQTEKGKALPYTNPKFELARRLWEFLCFKAGIENEKPWAEINNTKINKLSELLTRDAYFMQGKTTFKEEFVTCGGVNLKEIDFKTMQSKLVPNLFFCGEVLNIDGITGGYNFQSAWSTAWICAQNA